MSRFITTPVSSRGNLGIRIACLCLAAIVALAAIPDEAFAKARRRPATPARQQPARPRSPRPAPQPSRPQEAPPAPVKEEPEDQTPPPVATPQPSGWPRFSKAMPRGGDEVRIVNPNAVAVKVGLRSGSAGRDLTVRPNGTASFNVPDGAYDIYFEYTNERGTLYQGDSFQLAGNGIEIQLVHVANGNYGLRRVN